MECRPFGLAEGSKMLWKLSVLLGAAALNDKMYVQVG